MLHMSLLDKDLKSVVIMQLFKRWLQFYYRNLLKQMKYYLAAPGILYFDFNEIPVQININCSAKRLSHPES